MIEITAIYFVWLLRIFQPYLILSIENLLSTKPLLNLPILNRCTPFGVNISHEKAKTQGPQKNTNWSRQKRKVQGRGPNRSGTQKENDTYTKYLTKQKPKPIQKLKLE